MKVHKSEHCEDLCGNCGESDRWKFISENPTDQKGLYEIIFQCECDCRRVKYYDYKEDEL